MSKQGLFEKDLAYVTYLIFVTKNCLCINYVVVCK